MRKALPEDYFAYDWLLNRLATQSKAHPEMTPPHGWTCTCDLCRVWMAGRLSSLATALKPCSVCESRKSRRYIYLTASLLVLFWATVFIVYKVIFGGAA